VGRSRRKLPSLHLIMKLLAVFASLLLLATSVIAQSDQGLRISRSGTQPSSPGPAENFTGRVRVDAPFQAEAPARTGGALVTFEPAARTYWHTHPLGQTLIVTQGVGLVQRWGGPVQEIRPGDVVWIPSGAKHWHGAAPTTGMSHIAISERLDGKGVDWLEQVTDAQYASRTTTTGDTR
jgi:quercetin dioxygenase-like cupin family protein